jgi:hypothetical protein
MVVVVNGGGRPNTPAIKPSRPMGEPAHRRTHHTWADERQSDGYARVKTSRPTVMVACAPGDAWTPV